MGQDTRVRFIAIVILTLAFGYAVAPIPNKPKIPVLGDARINPGIDLAGGAELRYRVLYDDNMPGDRKALTETARTVIARRIEQKQLKEPKINVSGDDRILIQLAGVDRATLEDYKKLIQQAGQLELFAVAPRDVQEKWNKDKAPVEGFKPIDNTERSGRAEGEYAAYAGAQILIQDKPVLTGKEIVKADATKSMTSHGLAWATSFELSLDGAKAFDDAAKRLYNQRPPGLIAIVLDGKLRSAPRVNSEQFGGHGEITGSGDENEARNLAIILRSGSLPAPIGFVDKDGKRVLQQPESESFVGPTLGEDSIRRGILASGLTLGLTVLFMVVYYRTLGFIAAISLFLNLIFLTGVMAFFQATLTLPGLAGIVLTVGMAVDANILIYERIREEQQRGRSAAQAFDAGYERDFWAIMDSNLTTLITGIVLYYIGTGPVQGFALTLCLGIATTLFSVLFCGRVFLKMLIQGGAKEFRMMKAMSTPNFDFLKVARPVVIVSAIAVVAGTTFFLARGSANWGVDFKGGSTLTFAMAKDQTIDEIRRRLQSIKDARGLAKYPDFELQTVADPEATQAKSDLKGHARTFQLRVSTTDINGVKDDLQEVFKDVLSHEPFQEMKAEEVSKNPRFVNGHPPGPGWHVYVQTGTTLEDARKAVLAECRDLFQKDDKNEPLFVLEEAAGAPSGLRKLALTLTEEDSKRDGFRARLRDRLKSALGTKLAQDPFLAQAALGPAAAGELRNSTIWAMIVSWSLMIVYIALRFDSWRYGVAAVIALVHDSLLSIAFVSLAGALIPRAWGLSFDMNLTTMAAILTIIGYAINDKIVVFDRIRENLGLMKKATFAEVMNASLNGTLSRTILTGTMVWVASIILYVLTMHTGGGIAEFSFPLIIGILAGTYSSIYISCPIVLWWYKGRRPESIA
jgi:SecD/SecF fusion protein